MDRWTIQHHAFCVEADLKNNESVIATQRLFRNHFNIRYHFAIPFKHTISRCVSNLKTKGSVLKKKPPGSSKSVRTEEPIARVREPVLQSLKDQQEHILLFLGVSRTSLNRILHTEFNFHPY